MNDISFKLKVSKTDRSGRAPIFLEFNYEGQTLIYATGEKCALADWDAVRQKFRRSMPGYQEGNEYMERLRDKLRSAYRAARNSDLSITNDYLRGVLSGKSARTRAVKLLPVYEGYLKMRIEDDGLAKGTATAMRSTAVRMKRYLETGAGLRVDDYTHEVHRGFLNHMFQVQDLEPSSVANTCKHLITFFKWAAKTYTLSPDQAEIKKETFDSDRIYLTGEELLRIQTVALPPNLDRVRDAFVFQSLTGLRYTDLWRLQNHHVEQRDGYKVICLIDDKSVSRSTKMKRLEIPLLPGAIEILDRYAGNFRLLPILSNQEYNRYIKDVARAAGVVEMVETVEYVKGVPQIIQVEKWQRVSTHVARHTFATLSLIKGVPLEVVSKSLGHTKLSTTMVYAKVVDEWKNQIILKAWALPPPKQP